jgi:hypothetical protein
VFIYSTTGTAYLKNDHSFSSIAEVNNELGYAFTLYMLNGDGGEILSLIICNQKSGRKASEQPGE